MTITDVVQRLKDGNTRFVADNLEGNLADQQRRGELTAGQHPYAIVLSCADSRVVPELAFDTGLGEIFTIRVAGNVANTSSLASIEYAVAHIGTQVIVVMGHQACGAVTAAVSGGNNGYHLNHLLSHITPALAEAPADAAVDDIVRLNARLTARELVNRSPIVRGAVEAGKLKIIPAYYNLDTGRVDFLED